MDFRSSPSGLLALFCRSSRVNCPRRASGQSTQFAQNTIGFVRALFEASRSASLHLSGQSAQFAQNTIGFVRALFISGGLGVRDRPPFLRLVVKVYPEYHWVRSRDFDLIKRLSRGQFTRDGMHGRSVGVLLDRNKNRCSKNGEGAWCHDLDPAAMVPCGSTRLEVP